MKTGTSTAGIITIKSLRRKFSDGIFPLGEKLKLKSLPLPQKAKLAVFIVSENLSMMETDKLRYLAHSIGCIAAANFSDPLEQGAFIGYAARRLIERLKPNKFFPLEFTAGAINFSLTRNESNLYPYPKRLACRFSEAARIIVDKGRDPLEFIGQALEYAVQDIKDQKKEIMCFAKEYLKDSKAVRP